MKRVSLFVSSCVWGAASGAILGALRTRSAAMHLLAKNRALEAIGVPSLPGPSHWGTLDSYAPAGAGALFFGLSLGLGCGAALALWVSFSGTDDSTFRRWAPWLCLAAPLWAALEGDWGLSCTLFAIALGACLWPRGESHSPTLLLVACACIASVGLLPWALAQEGAFSRLRDRVLLSSNAGLTLNDFYYRWTLYPAEVLKPLDARSQPTAGPREGTSAAAWATFRASATSLGILCLPNAGAGADFVVEQGTEGFALVSGGQRTPWTEDPGLRRTAWKKFCRNADRAVPLRTATAFALFCGCPLGLAWALGSLSVWSGSRILPTRPRATAVAFAALVAVALAATGRADSRLQTLRTTRHASAADREREVRKSFVSQRPSERLYATRAAAALGRTWTPLLLRALNDPVVNVRYAAAEALGATGGEGVERRLLAVVRGQDEWYVKERAYAALWRLGWRPQGT